MESNSLCYFLFSHKFHSFYIYALLVWDLFIPQSRKYIFIYIYIKKTTTKWGKGEVSLAYLIKKKMETSSHNIQ